MRRWIWFKDEEDEGEKGEEKRSPLDTDFFPQNITQRCVALHYLCCIYLRTELAVRVRESGFKSPAPARCMYSWIWIQELKLCISAYQPRSAQLSTAQLSSAQAVDERERGRGKGNPTTRGATRAIEYKALVFSVGNKSIRALYCRYGNVSLLHMVALVRLCCCRCCL